MKLLTWLDVRRHIRSKTRYGTKLPDSIVSIRCFSNAVEIGVINKDNLKKAKHTLKEWFGDLYLENESVIKLDMDDAKLPVDFISREEVSLTNINVLPFWEEIAYLENSSTVIKIPEPFTEKPDLIAFYSFKEDIERELNLVAYVLDLLNTAKKEDKSISVLVLDTNLESPSLTYWNPFEHEQSTISFISFLELYHYSPIERDQAILLFANEIKKTPKIKDNSTIYFLPAYNDDKQLLDISILPEHLVRGTDGNWNYSNAIYELGKMVGADYVIIDLRSGLSKLSSPIIFDTRIKRFLVTSKDEQSLKGTNFVLEQIAKVAPSQTNITIKFTVNN